MSDKEIVIVESEESLAQQADPMLGMIDKVCSDPNFDIAKMEKLVEMRNAEIERQATIEFSKDFAKMQCELPAIEEKTQGHNYKYAAFEDVMAGIKPVMKGYGFAVSFNINQDDNFIKITASLLHRSGHKESTSIKLPHETSGSKNAVQAVGSTISYGKRYTLLSLLNIATCGEDVDGNTPLATINEAQLDEITTLLDDSGVDKIKFIRDYLKTDSLKNLPAKNYNKAVNVLRKRIQDANS